MRILYCSSGPVGLDMLGYLYDIGANVVQCVHNQPIDAYPDYDLGISFLYTHKIPAEQVEGHKWVNFHPGPLPEMRGRNLAYQAIMRDFDTFGATLHYMSAEYDTGDIIECRRFAILQSYSAGDLVKLAHKTLVNLFMEYVPLLVAGKEVPATPQAAGTYYEKSPINDEIILTAEQQRMIRAVTVTGKFTAKAMLGGIEYEIVPRGSRG